MSETLFFEEQQTMQQQFTETMPALQETAGQVLTPETVDAEFAALTGELEDLSIDPETEATMGVGRKSGGPIDPGYFTKDK